MLASSVCLVAVVLLQELPKGAGNIFLCELYNSKNFKFYYSKCSLPLTYNVKSALVSGMADQKKFGEGNGRLGFSGDVNAEADTTKAVIVFSSV